MNYSNGLLFVNYVKLSSLSCLLLLLLFSLEVNPVVTRNEIDLIWSRCHLKRDGNLEFYQFLREFGYSKRSAHYPNAKYNPPKRGDADFILTSNRLYGDSVLVRGAVLNVIRAKWDELRREFDPYRTSFIQSDEFDDILIELCPSVNQDDLDALKYRFQSTNDSRFDSISISFCLIVSFSIEKNKLCSIFET